MTPREAAAILRQHNEWHRWLEDGIGVMPTFVLQKQLDEAMDIAAKYIEDNEHE